MNGPFPQFWMQPFFQQPQQQPQERAPVRVQVAMALLARLHAKTTPIVAPHGMGCAEVIGEEGQKLTHEEEQCQCAALALLTQYFAGKLLRCEWDEPRQMPSTPQHGMPAPCPQCVGQGKFPDGCPYCSGHGVVLMR